MSRFGSAFALGFALYCTVSPAQAQSRDATFAPWHFFEGETQSGRAFCGMGSVRTDGGVGQNLMVKAFKNGDGIAVDLYKDRWNWPQGDVVHLMFDFVDNNPIEDDAYADGHMLEVVVAEEYMAMFLLAIRDAPFFQVIFPNDEDGNWTIPADGVDDVLGDLVACLRE